MSYSPLENSELGRSNAASLSSKSFFSANDDSNDGDTVSIKSRISQSFRKVTPLSEPLTTDNGQKEGFDERDPFYVFRNDLLRKLSSVDESLAEFLRIIHQTDTSVNTAELKDAKKQLKRHVKNAEATLKDVQTTVQLVENDRGRFPHIDEAELYERTSLVQTSERRLQNARDELTSKTVKAKMLADERAKAVRRAGVDSLGATNDEQRMNTNRIVDSQARTSLLMQHQDETLDDLDMAVTRVGVMAETINDEIGQQNKMLDEMEKDLENVEEELGMVMGKLAKFLHTKDRWQLRTIIILSGLVIVLFMLVLYT